MVEPLRQGAKIIKISNFEATPEDKGHGPLKPRKDQAAVTQRKPSYTWAGARVLQG